MSKTRGHSSLGHLGHRLGQIARSDIGDNVHTPRVGSYSPQNHAVYSKQFSYTALIPLPPPPAQPPHQIREPRGLKVGGLGVPPKGTSWSRPPGRWGVVARKKNLVHIWLFSVKKWRRGIDIFGTKHCGNKYRDPTKKTRETSNETAKPMQKKERNYQNCRGKMETFYRFGQNHFVRLLSHHYHWTIFTPSSGGVSDLFLKKLSTGPSVPRHTFTTRNTITVPPSGSS